MAWDEKDRQKFLDACRDNHFEIVKQMIASPDANDVDDLNKQDENGNTAFWWACHNGNFEIVKLMIKNYDKVNLNKQDKNGNTAFWWACHNGNFEIVKLMIENGDKIDLNKQDQNGNTAFMYASATCRTEIVKLMIENCDKVNLNKQDENGNTAFILACLEGSFEIAELMIKNNNKIDLNKQDKKGNTAFMYASATCRTEIVKLMIENCDKIDLKIAEDKILGLIKKVERRAIKNALVSNKDLAILQNISSFGKLAKKNIKSNYDAAMLLTTGSIAKMLAAKGAAGETKANIGIAYNKLVTNKTLEQKRRTYREIVGDIQCRQPIIKAVKDGLEKKLNNLNNECANEYAPNEYLGLGIKMQMIDGRMRIMEYAASIHMPRNIAQSNLVINGRIIKRAEDVLEARKTFKLGIPVQISFANDQDGMAKMQILVMPVLITTNKDNVMTRHDELFKDEVDKAYSVSANRSQ